MSQLPLFESPELLGLIPSDKSLIDALRQGLRRVRSRAGIAPEDRRALGAILAALARLPLAAPGLRASVAFETTGTGLPVRRSLVFDREGLRFVSELGPTGANPPETAFASGVGWRRSPSDPTEWVRLFLALAEASATLRVAAASAEPGTPIDLEEPSISPTDWWTLLERS